MTVPLDGRITSLDVLTGTLTGDEVMEIVSPGNAELGNNYQVTLALLATYFGNSSMSTTIILSGATLISPYDILITDTRILFNKTVSSASYAVAPLASLMTSSGVLIKDLKGDAGTFPITVSFTGGELCDGLSEITVENAFGWTTINPTPSGGSWYLS
jgi:hypothetical protein